MLNHDIAIAQELKIRLSAMVSLVDMRLFGSRARGDAQENSDMDIFVEVETVTSAIKDLIAEAAWDVGIKKLIHVSPLVFSRNDIENSPHRSSQIVQNILREGIKI